MQSFTNYYSEWNIPRDMPLASIQRKLSELCNDWTARKLNVPEEAILKLQLLNEALAIFKSEKSRAQYDRELAAANKEPSPGDPNAERAVQLEKWLADAKTYYKDGKADLAKVAIEKALALISPDRDNSLIYISAARIYLASNELETAMSYINKAIVENPNNTESYLVKFAILDGIRRKLSTQPNQQQTAVNETVVALKDLLDTAVEKATASHNDDMLDFAYGAFAYYWYFVVGSNESLAEDYARKALAINSENQNAKRVLESIGFDKIRSEEGLRDLAKITAENCGKPFSTNPLYSDLNIDGWELAHYFHHDYQHMKDNSYARTEGVDWFFFLKSNGELINISCDMEEIQPIISDIPYKIKVENTVISMPFEQLSEYHDGYSNSAYLLDFICRYMGTEEVSGRGNWMESTRYNYPKAIQNFNNISGRRPRGEGLLKKLKMLENNEANLKKWEEEKEVIRKQRQAEEEEKRRKSKEQSQRWASQGLCRYCGGKLSFFGRTCKNCNKAN